MSASAPPFHRLRTWLSHVCPEPVLKRVVDQTLADLAIDRDRHSKRLARLLATGVSLVRLFVALGFSLILQRHHWRRAPWWPPPTLARDAAGWFALLTLLTVAKVAFMRPEYERLRTLSPDFIVTKLLPIALPAAAVGLSLMATGGRKAASVAVVAVTAAALSLTSSMIIPAGLRQSPAPTVIQATNTMVIVDGRPMPRTVWERFQAHRARGARHDRHVVLSMAASCITLPVLTVVLTSLLRRSASLLVALAAAAATLDMLLEWRNSLPVPMTTLSAANLAAWLPQIVLAVATVTLGALALARSRLVNSGRSTDAFR